MCNYNTWCYIEFPRTHRTFLLFGLIIRLFSVMNKYALNHQKASIFNLALKISYLFDLWYLSFQSQNCDNLKNITANYFYIIFPLNEFTFFFNKHFLNHNFFNIVLLFRRFFLKITSLWLSKNIDLNTRLSIIFIIT